MAEFFAGRLPWIKIADVVGKTLEKSEFFDPQTLDDVLSADSHARAVALEIAKKME